MIEYATISMAMTTEHHPIGSENADSHGSHDIAIAIPREEKKLRLARMSENDFRDRIVRPLFLALKYRDGRDLHGPDEDGKDVVFIEDDKFGRTRVVCVQTKKGNLNMSSAVTKNIGIAVTQLKMALEAPVSLLESREKRHVDEVVLCASGKINKRATEYIVSELAQNRGIRFLDAESIIDLIDHHYPLLWQGLSFDIFAHYDAIRKHVEHEASDIIAPSAASDNVALLVDGVDEITDTRKRRSLYDALIDFRSFYPKCAVTRRRCICSS